MDSQTERHLESCREAWSDASPDHRVLAGLDGFVDRVRHMVRRRTDTDTYQRFQRLGDVAGRIGDATRLGSSCTVEWIRRSARTGGFTSNFGGGCQALGLETFLVGHFGTPIQPVFRQQFDPDRLLSLGEPGYTEIVEFRDGKLSLPEIGNQAALNWRTILQSVGLDTLATWTEGTDLLALGYWSLFPELPEMLDGIREQLLPRLRTPPDHVLIDPAEINRLPREKLREGLDSVRALNDAVPVTLTANRTETRTLATLFTSQEGEELEDWVEVCSRGLGVHQFVGHGKNLAVADVDGRQFRIQSPVTEEPAINVGAGDHFAAGVALGLMEELPPGAMLITASLVAGCYVREGISPDWERVSSFLGTYPKYEPAVRQ